MELKPPPDFLTWLQGDGGRTALAGALGGVVRWMTLREHWSDGLISLGVGSICALYLSPLVEPLMAPLVEHLAPNGDSGGFAAFVVGLGGISLSGVLIDVIRARGKSWRK